MLTAIELNRTEQETMPYTRVLIKLQNLWRFDHDDTQWHSKVCRLWFTKFHEISLIDSKECPHRSSRIRSSTRNRIHRGNIILVNFMFLILVIRANLLKLPKWFPNVTLCWSLFFSSSGNIGYIQSILWLFYRYLINFSLHHNFWI